MADHDGLCPECNGLGYIEGECTYFGDHNNPPEYQELICRGCDGTGTLTAIPTEEEADEYERWLDGL